MISINDKILCYERVKNLKVAASELGMNFQTLYWQLKQAGVSVSGDKERWGSIKDRFAANAEKMFQSLVPAAKNNNETKFQAKCDFLVGDIRVEIKASKRQSLGAGKGGDRWAFSIKKQHVIADFFVMFAYSPDAHLEKIFLIPSELICGTQSISISVNGKSKWHAYEVTGEQLSSIFNEIN